jgi:pimeloyl-ACP methyl ester carboxylesterase
LSASAGPVLFVAGSLDGRAAGAASAVGAVADAAVGVVAVPGVGHALLSEAPGAVVGALASWVDAQIRSE